MSLRAPDLDERDFDGLVAEALRFIRSRTSAKVADLSQPNSNSITTLA